MHRWDRRERLDGLSRARLSAITLHRDTRNGVAYRLKSGFIEVVEETDLVALAFGRVLEGAHLRAQK